MADIRTPISELPTEELQALIESIPLEIEELREQWKKGQTAEYWKEIALFGKIVAEISRRKRENEKDEIAKQPK